MRYYKNTYTNMINTGKRTGILELRFRGRALVGDSYFFCILFEGSEGGFTPCTQAGLKLATYVAQDDHAVWSSYLHLSTVPTTGLQYLTQFRQGWGSNHRLLHVQINQALYQHPQPFCILLVFNCSTRIYPCIIFIYPNICFKNFTRFSLYITGSKELLFYILFFFPTFI